MRKTKNLIACTLLLSIFFSCSNKYYYIKGLNAAQNPTPEKVYKGLTVIDQGNKDLVWNTINGKPYVLAVTWKSDTTFYTKPNLLDAATGCYKYNTGNYPIFVTAAPYLKKMEAGGLSDSKLTLRLDQLLGLPPTSLYAYFLELWVSPEDMVRPCFDPSLNASVCEFTPSKKDNDRADYMCWLYTYIYGSYCDTNAMNRYPFSHLGYTYDWSRKNKSHVGLSEFVVNQNKTVYIRKVYTTRNYFQ